MLRYLSALLIASAAVAISEWRTDEDIITMSVLLLVSFGLGFYRPRLFFWSAVVTGSVVALLGLLSQVTGLQPVYSDGAAGGNGGVAQPATMLVLIVPALVAAFAGRLAARKRLQPQTRNPA